MTQVSHICDRAIESRDAERSLLFLVFCVLPVAAVRGQPTPEFGCAGDVPHHRIVYEATNPKVLGLTRQEVLDALVCIAKTQGGEFARNRPVQAVAVLFVISDPAEARAGLLNVIASREISAESHHAAANLLVYVSDDASNQQMLGMLKEALANLSRNWSSYFDYFREVGYQPYSDWLRAELRANVGVPVPTSLLEQELRFTEVRGDRVQIVAQLQACGKQSYGPWLVRNAFKAGATMDEVRSAILKASKHIESLQKLDLCVMDSIREYDDLVGLDDSMKSELGPLWELGRFSDEGYIPKWVQEKIKAKRRLYYQVDSGDR